jgi:hypothetical protein
MDPILVDAVCRAMLILETSRLNEEFDDETLTFLQDLYVWRRPDKFLVNGGPFKFVSGRVVLWSQHQRCLQFEFDNGYIWEASITKLGSRTLIAHCRQWVRQHLDSYYMDVEEAA